MLTPAELRDECRLTKEAIAKESAPELKRQLARCGFALAQLAEKIERDEAARKPPPGLGA